MKNNNESFDDIIFENRNKEYGAYDLRKRYANRGALAFAISLFILFTAVGWPLLASIMSTGGYLGPIVPFDEITLSGVLMEKPEVMPPRLPEPPKVNKPPVFEVPNIVDSITNIEEEMLPNELFGDIKNAPLGDTGRYIPEKIEIEKEPMVEKIVDIFELNEKPIFPDGDAGIIRYIAENTKYPLSALENNIEGTVYIRFVVTKNGDIGDAKVMRQVDQSLELEAIRVVESMPKWIPGKINGTPVNVWFIIPVKFELRY